MKLVVALGNPGTQYEFTRHNIGQLACDQVSFYETLNWQNKFKGRYAQKNINGEKVFFLYPLTFMNLSGQSVGPLVNFFKIAIEDILVVHDELDLDFGTISFKKGGGLAGHNGLKSIKESLGKADFCRMRLGISRPIHGSVSSFVLSSFSAEEEINLTEVLTTGGKAIETYLKSGLEKAAQQFNKKNFSGVK